MALLDSLLAFALTLAVLATVVTLLLETLIRFLGMKRKGQVEIIGRLLGDVVPDAEARWQAVKKILENPFADGEMAAKEADQGYAGWQANAIYTEVSLEHVLRRLADSVSDADLVKKTQAEVKAELESLARKYDEFASALSANFKRRAQLWSIVIGIILALAMNIDGLRILKTYLQDPALRQSIIDKVEIPQNEGPAEADEQGPSGSSDLDQKISELKAQLALVDELTLPIGGAYYPHCKRMMTVKEREASSDPLCNPNGTPADSGDFLAWLAKVLVTGLLIGLGAPFWYDVARRLAAVRTVLGGKGSGEDEHRGSDAKGDAAERDALLGRIAADAKAAAASRVEQGS